MIIEQLSDTKRYTASELQIIDFIMQHPRVVIHLSLQELCHECFVSQASVIRLCKKLGAGGYANFKVLLAQELIAFATDNQSIPVDIPISPNSSCQDVSKTFYNLSLQALESTLKELDYPSIKAAASLLASADSIHLFGRGESLIIAEDFHYKLLRIGYNSILESQNGFQDVFSSQPNTKTTHVAMVISQYCNSRHTNYIIDEIVSSRLPMILVTAARHAWPYDKYADVTLRIPITESRYKMGPFASRTAFMFLLDCVFGQMFSLNYDRNSNNLRDYSQRRSAREYYYKALEEN